MTFCRKCGKQLDDGVRDCPYCGTSVDPQARVGPAPQDDRSKTRLNQILSVMIMLILVTAAIWIFFPPTPADNNPTYRVTVSMDEIYIYDTTKMLGSNDGYRSETYIMLSYGSEADFKSNTEKKITSDHWNLPIYSKDPVVTKGSDLKNSTFTFDTKYALDKMTFQLRVVNFHNDTVSDEIDIFTPHEIVGDVPSYAGFSGVQFTLENRSSQVTFEGDSAPIGHIKMTFNSEKLRP